MHAYTHTHRIEITQKNYMRAVMETRSLPARAAMFGEWGDSRGRRGKMTDPH